MMLSEQQVLLDEPESSATASAKASADKMMGLLWSSAACTNPSGSRLS